MTSAKWRSVEVQTVALDALILTQPGVYFHALIKDEAPVGGDPFLHVIHWRGALYLEDGHHRAVRAALRGQTHLPARVLAI